MAPPYDLHGDAKYARLPHRTRPRPAMPTSPMIAGTIVTTPSTKITPAMTSAQRAAAEKPPRRVLPRRSRPDDHNPEWRLNVPRASRQPRRLALPASERFIYTRNDGTATEDSTKLSSVGSHLDRNDDGTPQHIRVHWPPRPTTAAASHYPAMAAAIVRIIAESATAVARHKAGGPTMRRDLQAFVLSLGGLLAVAGSALLVLWAMVS